MKNLCGTPGMRTWSLLWWNGLRMWLIFWRVQGARVRSLAVQHRLFMLRHGYYTIAYEDINTKKQKGKIALLKYYVHESK